MEKHTANGNIVVTHGITEITSDKYAELTGITHKCVKNWCLSGVLTCRKINSKGEEVTVEENRHARWYVDITKGINSKPS